jgi:hypothetical protein
MATSAPTMEMMLGMIGVNSIMGIDIVAFEACTHTEWGIGVNPC